MSDDKKKKSAAKRVFEALTGIESEEKTPIERHHVAEVNACPVCGSLFDGIRCVVDGFQTVKS